MFNSNDIYSHIANGGDKQVLFDALMQEIAKAEDKIKAEKDADKLAIKTLKARSAAFKALKSYFTLVNPDVTEDIINSVLDTLETVEIKINGARGKRKDCGILEQTIDLTDEEWKEIWNTVFPFHFKRK